MASKPEAEAMQELASMLWSRFLKERVREELNHELNAYKAEVVSNNGNGTLTVRRPFESVTPTLKAAPSLAYAQPGDMVMVVGIGDKSKALSNAFVLAKADLSDDTSVPVYGQGENLLRNWYFAGGGTGKGVFPVNRRGLTTYSGAVQYTVDGWRTTNSNTSVTLTASALVTRAVSGSTAYLVQYLTNQDSLLGKTVTLSILTSTGLRHATVKLPSTRPSAITVYANIANIGQIIWLSGSWCVRFISVANGGNTYIAAKLEIGTEQTLAHQENGAWVLNELPDYEEELVKCQTTSADNSDTYSQKSLATEQQIAYVENGLTASRAYAKGEYFCWNGLLYRVTAAISSGQTFTAQNCAQVPEGGFNHLKPLDISTAITAFSNRLTNVTVKAWFYPSNRKIELSAYGEAATTLSTTQNTLFTTSTAYAPSGVTFAGCAVKKQTDIVAVWANSTLINVQHGGLAQGDSISVNLSWYI